MGTCYGANFNGANFNGANFNGTNFNGANRHLDDRRDLLLISIALQLLLDQEISPIVEMTAALKASRHL
nr:pentapeptide repeat-containing protein [Pedobacter panaciterrae]